MKEYIITVDDSKPDIMGSVPLMEPPKGLIRCKDCKHYYNGCCYSRVSNRINFTVEVSDDWYCADGESVAKS